MFLLGHPRQMPYGSGKSVTMGCSIRALLRLGVRVRMQVVTCQDKSVVDNGRHPSVKRVRTHALGDETNAEMISIEYAASLCKRFGYMAKHLPQPRRKVPARGLPNAYTLEAVIAPIVVTEGVHAMLADLKRREADRLHT